MEKKKDARNERINLREVRQRKIRIGQDGKDRETLEDAFPEIYVPALRYTLCSPSSFNKLRAAAEKNVLTSTTTLFERP